jgi:malate permease and related proteins
VAFYTVLYQVIIMFLLLGTGFFIFKIRILDENACKSITRLLLMVVSPVVIVYSFQLKFDFSLLQGLFISAASAIGSHFFMILAGNLIYNRRTTDEAHRALLRFSTVYSNCGFMGIPLLAAVLGPKGVFYASVYIAVFNVFTWTHGVSVFGGKPSRKDLLRLLINPNIIAIAVGILFFCLSIKIPFLISDCMKYIFEMNTPLAMFVIGARTAQIDPRSLLTDRHIWPGVLFRNFILPLAFMFILHAFGVSGILLLGCLLPVACPVAGNAVLIPDMFGVDTRFTAKLLSVSTLFSVVSIPLIVYIVSVLHY